MTPRVTVPNRYLSKATAGFGLDRAQVADKAVFKSVVAGALRSPWRLRAAAVRQSLRQQGLSLKIRTRHSDTPVLLIYQMGKVGSTNMVQALKAQDPSARVYQVHRMHRPYIDALYRRYRSNTQAPYYFCNVIGHALRRSYLDNPSTPEVRILCPVREPVARNISHFFQDIERFIPRDPLPVSIDQVIDLFVQKFEHDYPEQWFTSEFLPTTGIDVLHAPFDRDAGFAVYTKGRIKALVYKVEAAASDDFRAAFKAFCGYDYPKTAQHNIGRTKKYGALYARFKEARSLPIGFCQEQHKTPFATQFYTQDDRRTAQARLCSDFKEVHD